MKSRESQLDVFSKQLELLSPQRILERGYALVTDENGRLVRKATAVALATRSMSALPRGSFRLKLPARATETMGSFVDDMTVA